MYLCVCFLCMLQQGHSSFLISSVFVSNTYVKQPKAVLVKLEGLMEELFIYMLCIVFLKER